MVGKLHGRVASLLVAPGIGFATAKLFERAYVFITGRRQKELGDAVKRHWGTMFAASKETSPNCLTLAGCTNGRIHACRRAAGDPERQSIGHTPGHVSVMIESKGEQALITGDFMHYPCQIAHPEWDTTADSDPAWGIQTRRMMFDRLAGCPVLVIGTHFAGATAGRIVRDGVAYRLDV